MQEFVLNVSTCAKLLQKEQKQLSAKAATASRRSAGKDPNQEREQVLYKIAPVVTKLKSMLEIMDCRHLLHEVCRMVTVEILLLHIYT